MTCHAMHHAEGLCGEDPRCSLAILSQGKMSAQQPSAVCIHKWSGGERVPTSDPHWVLYLSVEDDYKDEEERQ